MKLHADTFLSAKFDNDMKTFFLSQPDQKFILFQDLLGRVISYSSPYFIWTSSCLFRGTLFVRLHTDNFFSAKFDNMRSEFFAEFGNDMSKFFQDNPEQFFFLFQRLLGSIHSYSSPHSIWTIPWLDWKTLFVILHTDKFWAQKLTTT